MEEYLKLIEDSLKDGFYTVETLSNELIGIKVNNTDVEIYKCDDNKIAINAVFFNCVDNIPRNVSGYINDNKLSSNLKSIIYNILD